MKLNITSKFKKQVFIIIASILSLLLLINITMSHVHNISVNQLARQQRVVLDTTFSSQDAIKELNPSPSVKYNGWFGEKSLNYKINGLNPDSNNIVFFIYPITNLASSEAYDIEFALNYQTTSLNQEKLLLSWTNQDISQAPLTNDVNKLATNIDYDKLEGKEFFVDTNMHEYQTKLHATSNAEGCIYLLVAIKSGDNTDLNFSLNDFKYQIKVNNDNINKQ